MRGILLDVHMTVERTWEVDSDLIRLFLIVCLIGAVYFFSYQIQVKIASAMKKFSEKIGTYSVSKEFTLQRYVYQHSTGLFARLYRWVNAQLVALGMKRLGITVFGYLLFWAVIAIVLGLIASFVLNMGLAFSPFMIVMLYVVMLVMTRVIVSERMEKRERDVMDAIDLIVPEVKTGIKNAIVAYRDNFAPSVRDDFVAFIVNVQDRGYPFEDAMYILADNLGVVFNDFAQKAIYFEAVGEKEMVDIFTDISETNRLRRQLRDENSNAFAALKSSFVVSTIAVVGYFFFLMFTDDFSREFFLSSTAGKFLLLVMVGVVFAVLAYISTIKSKAI